MQPDQPQDRDIQTLADWIYAQFKPTDPVEIQNILPTPYYFKYCVGENVVTPDPVSRQVLERQYEEHTLEPGESKVLMGAAAYIFVDGVAREYVFNKQGAEATADIPKLIKAAQLAIVGVINYTSNAQKRHMEATAPTVRRVPDEELEPQVPAGHNPNTMASDPAADVGHTPATAIEEPEEAFDSADDTPADQPAASAFEHDGHAYDTITMANGAVRYRKDGTFVKEPEYLAAQEAYNAAPASQS